MAPTYFFTTEQVDDDFVSKMKVLNDFGDEAFKSIITIIFTFMVEPGQAEELVDSIEDFSVEHKVKGNVVKKSLQACLTVLRASLKMNLTPEKLKSDFLAFGFDDAKATLVARGWKANMMTLSRNVAAMALNANKLLDLEWRFGIAAGSSEKRKAGHTFLQLKLVLDKGSHTEDVLMEMTVPQFYSFLKEMQIAKRTMEILSN